MKDYFAKALIYNFENNIHNGHSQPEVDKNFLNVHELPEFCDYVENVLNDHYDECYSCFVQLWGDSSWSIYVSGFWKDGEHTRGHKDKLVVSTGD